MSKPTDVNNILATNQNIDAGKLKEVLEVLADLRRLGIKGAQYNLLHPFARRRSPVADEGKEDPRCVNLGR